MADIALSPVGEHAFVALPPPTGQSPHVLVNQHSVSRMLATKQSPPSRCLKIKLLIWI
ncbi:hypothetical protein LGM43_25035 [Burkholderia seminalis]|uniref:hypothetical protein n=1 Tax=Burkholderia seminalis TaxID=488731 RepID=UPI001905B96E|nr:hypothetical protein [Burkholderia seminalis]MBJ9969323.1 hypothetical protein [Burkholderia seminalis]MCA7953537.1 hypothetical protein [Burkholderia seminalis]